MSSTNRTAILTKVHKVLKKHYKPVSPAERSLLDHLLYACCLENARFEAADEAFAKLQENLFDWNEVRVTTVAELAEILSCLPDAAAAAQRVKKSLQSIFEAYYSFDLESWKKQNLGKSEKDLEKVHGITPFVLAYVVQNALEGHSIPVNKGAIDILYAVGAISDQEADKHQVPGMERAVPKNKGTEFGSLLHQFGADFFASPGSSKLKAILGEIDSDFKERLSARQARQEQEAADASARRKDAAQKARAAAALEKAKPPVKEPPKSHGKSGSSSKPTGGKDAAKPAPSAAKETPKPAAPAAKETAKPVPPKTPAKDTSKTPDAKAKPKDGKDSKDKKPAEKKAEPLKEVKKVSKGLAKKKPR